MESTSDTLTPDQLSDFEKGGSLFNNLVEQSVKAETILRSQLHT